MTELILTETDDRGVCRITLNRPEIHNAFNADLIAALTAAIAAAGDGKTRVLVLQGSGKSFSAGADLEWMKRARDFSEEQNIDDAMTLGRMLNSLAAAPLPTIALVHGAAIAGGTGLVACCDIAVAVLDAVFGLSEVRLGLIPATISPHVIAKIGARNARRYFLTAERFDAVEARRMGLIQTVVADAGDLAAAGEKLIAEILSSAPGAVAATKALARDLGGGHVSDDQSRDLARRLALRRASKEAKEGINAFFEKRPPPWAT